MFEAHKTGLCTFFLDEVEKYPKKSLMHFRFDPIFLDSTRFYTKTNFMIFFPMVKIVHFEKILFVK